MSNFNDFYNQANKLYRERYNFDDVKWHEIIRRVSTGTGCTIDADVISEHIGLSGVAESVRRTGGQHRDAREIQANLLVIRKADLAKHGFREVRR